MKYFYSKIKPFIVNQQWAVYHVSCDLSVTQIMWAIQKGPTPTKNSAIAKYFLEAGSSNHQLSESH